MGDYKVTGRIIINGTIELLSPAIIGSGGSELADVEILRDIETGSPFIPATSLIGVLKHHIGKDKLKDITEKEKKQYDKNYDFLFGKETEKDKKKESVQGALICSDLTTEKADITTRDGVSIDSKTGIVKDKCKFNYEIIEPGAKFKLRWEIVLREAFDKGVFKRILATMVNEMASGNISIGAMTNKGFGRFKLKDFNYTELDFSKTDNVLSWLENEYTDTKTDLDEEPYTLENPKSFSIDAHFYIKNSLIVRSYSKDAEMTSPDAVHITSNKKYVLPGTSIMGAIRHRAEKILRTINVKNPEDEIKQLFGDVDKDTKKKSKGRIRVEENKINFVTPELQTRIKIDRFTGGTIEGALFDSMPLWQKDKDKSVNVSLSIQNFKAWEAGLMLQVLKDLWTGDLAIGGEKNIGRGVLQGVCAKITDGNELALTLKAGDNESFARAKEKLKKYEEALTKKVEELNNG